MGGDERRLPRSFQRVGRPAFLCPETEYLLYPLQFLEYTPKKGNLCLVYAKGFIGLVQQISRGGIGENAYQ